MPCPFFEPTSIATDPHAAHARLPLIAEHDGFCHATAIPTVTPTEWRFAGCNHGREPERCPRFPSTSRPAIRRFTVQEKTEAMLTILVSEEIDHVPVRWRQVRYSPSSREVFDSSSDRCELAQIRAFCATYLQRFS